MKNRNYLICALISTFILYLDISLNVMVNSLDLNGILGDKWWFILLIVICFFNWFNAFGEDKIINIITLCLSFLPVIILIIFIFTTKNQLIPYKKAQLTNLLLDLVLFIPIYIIRIKELRKAQ